MRLFVLVCRVIGFAAFLMAFSQQGHSASGDLSLRTDYQLSPEKLTTDRINELDSDAINPHRMRWLVVTDIEIFGLEAFSKNETSFGVRASSLHSKAQGYIRPEGPWYFSLAEFPCEKNPVYWFATEEGTKKAVSVAALLWGEQVDLHKTQLEVIFSRLSAFSEKEALEKGRIAFNEWKNELNRDWRELSQKKAREEEWKTYWEEVKETGQCPSAKGKKVSLNSVIAVPWYKMMEPVSPEPISDANPVARLPARLWNGLFTVRANVGAGTKVVNGRFLIDSGAPRSILSPGWLGKQGILPTLLRIPGASPEQARFSVPWQNPEGSWADLILPDFIEIGPFRLASKQFLLSETDFFGPPEFVGECCDGVLGADLLRSYPIEFRPGPAPEVLIWPRKDFKGHGDQVLWVEMSQGPGTRFLSSCTVVPEGSIVNSTRNSLAGVAWDTGSSTPIGIYSSWKAIFQRNSPKGWKVDCQSLPMGPSMDGKLLRGTSEVPAVSIGLPFLSRGPFTLDLPHGRIWFAKSTPDLPLPPQNVSGLTLKYRLREDRELFVQSIRLNPRTQVLMKEGLKAGALITQIDGKPVEEMDFWEVERRLAGDFGNPISLQWKIKGGRKMAPFQVR